MRNNVDSTILKTILESSKHLQFENLFLFLLSIPNFIKFPCEIFDFLILQHHIAKKLKFVFRYNSRNKVDLTIPKTLLETLKHL